MRLTLLEAKYCLQLIALQHGQGYAEDAQVGKLQAKLSMLLELGAKMGDPQTPDIPVKKP